MIPLFWPQQFKEEWLRDLADTFDSRWLGQGPKVDEFEKRFGEKFNCEYCVAVNSGTSALELAYTLCDIKEEDEVITPVLTCTATNIPLKRRYASINFADVSNNLTMSYGSVREKISEDTSAIVAVSLGGIQIDNRIFRLAREYSVPVIVDAAQSLGVMAEPSADYICYSFQAIKHFTTGDGGMLVCRNEGDYKRAKKLRWFGIDREAKKANDWQWSSDRDISQDLTMAGYKFHMNDIAATMGMVGLEHSDEILAYRKMLCKRYEDNLRGYVNTICGGSFWLFCILVENRDYIMRELRHYGVECDTIQVRNDIFEVFGGRRRNLPNMDRLEGRYLYLPLNSKVTTQDVDYISGRVVQALTRTESYYKECDRCHRLHFIHQTCESSQRIGPL